MSRRAWSRRRSRARGLSLLAEQFDEDLFLIFKLRGRTKEEIIEALRERRASSTEDKEANAAPCLAFSSNETVRPLEELIDSIREVAGEREESEEIEER